MLLMPFLMKIIQYFLFNIIPLAILHNIKNIKITLSKLQLNKNYPRMNRKKYYVFICSIFCTFLFNFFHI